MELESQIRQVSLDENLVLAVVVVVVEFLTLLKKKVVVMVASIFRLDLIKMMVGSICNVEE